jgi:hypothetical protein
VKKHWFTIDQFSTQAKPLRREFEEHFADPLGNAREISAKRFVWDYWHVPGQYSLLRTPAYHYFSEKIYMRFHKNLVDWGRQFLGCWDISPPWLSCYIDGCDQEFHQDRPHGPWAFVFSLSPTKATFSGGQTEILRPEILDYWRSSGGLVNFEKSGMMDSISPKFNRLIVFDPRIPHRVSPVRGSRDPRLGRLVIHGWFSNPKTYIDGFLSEKKAEEILNQAFAQVQMASQKAPLCSGVMNLALKISKAGRVNSVKALTHTLVAQEGLSLDKEIRLLERKILQIYKNLRFPEAKGATRATIPLLFS